MIDEIEEEEYVSPLVVHKKSDASYQETAIEVGMQVTHTEEESADEPTLERHRFKKKKKKSKLPYVLVFLLAVLVIVVAVLVKNGIVSFDREQTTASTQKAYVTQPENSFKGIITVKGAYLFFEGTEVDGINGLEREIKYLEKGTKFVVQDENANEQFLNFEVLSLLSKYDIDYDITHVVSTGLMSAYETTVPPTEVAEQSTEAEAPPAE